MDTEHTTEISARDFADQISARLVRSIEFGANQYDEQPEIAIHLHDSTTLFVGAGDQGKLYFAKPNES